MRSPSIDGSSAASPASSLMAIPRSHTGSTGPSGGRASPAERSPCSWNRFCVRPLFARAASDHVRSLKVLQRAGFAIIGTAISFANARNKEIEETILRLDEPAKSAPPDASSGDRQTY